MTRVPAAVATFGALSTLEAKTGHGIARFCDHVVAIIDTEHAGRAACDVEPYITRPIPVVATLEDACALGAEEVVLGCAPPGGDAQQGIVDFVETVLARGLWLVSGLHTRLGDVFPDARRLVELRHLPVPELVGHGRAAQLPCEVLLTVGSDCASGKMTTALELHRLLRHRLSTRFVATGQTGLYVAGRGVCIDAVRADFLAGVVEAEVLAAADGGTELILVEGQGSLFHPAYSGVALGLLHGSAPSKLVFCHDVARTELAYFGRQIGDLAHQIELTQQMASVLRPAEVVAVSVMLPPRLPDAVAATRMRELETALGLPVVSPRTGLGPLVDRVARS